ncbi:MAG: DEAD/DEAH box helicase [Candidatus Electrothrix sp. GW3-4]|uniref:DEAD/DEAH box helicase n=1 Tax=Candidatus Electrothrix sp. GW3-4 TaxID=3126740 RepID=UPI0030D23CC1
MPDQTNDQLPPVHTLPPFEQFLLQFISIIYEPVSTTFLGNCLAGTDIPIPEVHRLTSNELDSTINQLREQQFLNELNQCPPHLAEQLTRQAVTEGRFTDLAALIEKKAPVSYLYGKWATRCQRALRQFRIGLYSGDFDKVDEAVTFLEKHGREHTGPEPPAVRITARNFDAAWFGTLPGFQQFFLLNTIIHYSMDKVCHFPAVIAYLEDEEGMTLSEDERVPFRRMLAGYYLLQGNFEKLASLLEAYAEAFQGSGFAGTLAFLEGQVDRALELFEEDLIQLNKYAGPEGTFFFNITGVFCILSFLIRNTEKDRSLIHRAVALVLERCKGCPEEVPFRFLDAYVRSVDGTLPDMRVLTDQLSAEERGLSSLIAVLSLYWMGVEIPQELQNDLLSLYQQAEQNSFFWLAMEGAELLGALDSNQADLADAAKILRKQYNCTSIVHIIATDNNSWKQSLQDLITVTSRSRKPEKTSRLVWLVQFDGENLMLSAKEQKRKGAGKWSKGRGIGLNRLMPPEDFDFLTEQDVKICAALRQVGDPNSRNGGCEFDMNEALPALVGHPLVFLEKSGKIPAEIVAGEPELMVEEQDGHLFIHFLQDIGKGKVAVWPETPTRFRVMEINDEHRRVAEITGRDGLRIPISASGQVLNAIGNIASFMTVHSSINVGSAEQGVQIVESDSTIHLHIIPYGSGFRLEMFVQPFSRRGPYLKPGAGVANLMAEVDKRRMQTRRNLLLEEEKAREVEESCPILDLAVDLEQENDREWHMLDPEECLQALLELEEIRDRVVLEWPEGERLAVRRRAGVNQLNLNIRTSQQNWFALSGHVKVDQDEVIDLKSLLDKIRESHSRFIPLGKGQFLALTQEFRDRLEDLIQFGDNKGSKGSKDGEGAEDGEVQVHPLAALALDDLTRQANTNADEGWREQLKRINFVQDFVPEVPSTLQAELRDYQAEGFVWMARLAHLGVGGCLADDMGLGKTLQSLAVILDRAENGPSLVIAPTSVCLNWEQEAARFAPTLTLHTLTGVDREAIVQGLGKRDILVTSYTLLQQEVDLLETVSWRTVVLDEAQSIKNAATKRSKAAMRLKAKFRLITTGTPIENHLGELWNLFNFINCGLLGTYKQFNSRFGIPIEKHQDHAARRQLKKLIRPFMLRRIKSEVLDELPPRTEITLRVEMKKSEMQFYEAIRQQAIENIESNGQKSGRHLQILAEIMRLRRACCNPRLIDESSKISSSKLQVFAEVVEELLESRHKALVFSQFTGHLALICEYLDKEGVSYKYLDGTTPARERIKRVDAFQAGEGDLFLISLKAGGLGLNLTAADYVIHMDPWWNPAVEDQAADRAHRIGQKRPVTVYRLVTTDTIEEKIVQLHHEKRNLANSLLEGTDTGARISADELLELIRAS